MLWEVCDHTPAGHWRQFFTVSLPEISPETVSIYGRTFTMWKVRHQNAHRLWNWSSRLLLHWNWNIMKSRISLYVVDAAVRAVILDVCFLLSLYSCSQHNRNKVTANVLRSLESAKLQCEFKSSKRWKWGWTSCFQRLNSSSSRLFFFIDVKTDVWCVQA